MKNIIENNFTDQQLVNKALSGDTNAFVGIIKISEGLVTQIIFKMVHNSPDRKDILQDVYIKVYKNLGGFKFQSKLTTWIARITYRICLDHLAKKKLMPVGDLFDETNEERIFGQAKNDDGEGAVELDRKLMNSDLAGILGKEIQKLSPVYRTLITLYHNEDMSYEELADITGLPDGTVKNYLFRARKELKKSLLKNYKREDL